MIPNYFLLVISPSKRTFKLSLVNNRIQPSISLVLGDDWESYAKKSLYSTIDDSTIFVQSRDIFDSALEVWLELRREINLIEDEVSKKQSQKLALQQKDPAAIDENRQDPQHVGEESKKSFEEIEDFPKLQLFEEEQKEIYGEIVSEKETNSMEDLVEVKSKYLWKYDHQPS